MKFFTCKKCKHVEKFLKQFAYQLDSAVCPNCGQTPGWTEHTGEIHEVVLDMEDKQYPALKAKQLDALTKRDAAQAAHDDAVKDKKALEARHRKEAKPTDDRQAAMLDELKTANEALTKTFGELQKAQRALDDVDSKISDLGERKAVRRDAGVAYEAAASVQDKSKKNKLYIGNRQYVSNHAKKGPQKKARILDVPNWSPGLNVAWIEGGISAKAHFKIKLDASNPYADIPKKVLEAMADDPEMDGLAFIKMCRDEGKGSLLWYDKDGASRLTWTAMEIWCLLRAGYRFTFADSKTDGPGRKIVLVPPH